MIEHWHDDDAHITIDPALFYRQTDTVLNIQTNKLENARESAYLRQVK